MSMFKSKHSGWTWDLKRTPFGGGKGGGGGAPSQTTSTAYQTNIPEYAQPYVETMLGATQKQLFNMDESGNITGFSPYKPYSTNPQDYVAPFSPMQQQAQQGVANLTLPGTYQAGADISGAAAMGGMGLAGQQARAGQNYQRQATSMYGPGSVGDYMNPYIAQSLAPQLQQLNQQFGIKGAAEQGAATSAGAFGGSRNALMQGLNQQNQMLAQQQAIAQGYDKAFQAAQQAQQFGANLGLQGQSAAQQGLGQATQAAGQMAGIGGQALEAQKGIYGAQATAGAQQQAQQQQMINQAITDYANAQQYPLMQLGTMSNMLRGLPMQAQTTNQYVAAPNPITQGIGLAGAGASIYNALGGGKAAGQKAGGVVGMAKGGIASYRGGDLIDSTESDLYDMPVENLQKELKSPSPTIRRMAERIMREKTGKAGGGIIAFANGTEDTVGADARAALGKDLLAGYEQEVADRSAAKFNFGEPRKAAPVVSQVAAAPVEKADPAMVRQAQIEAAQMQARDSGYVPPTSPAASTGAGRGSGMGPGTSRFKTPEQPTGIATAAPDVRVGRGGVKVQPDVSPRLAAARAYEEKQKAAQPYVLNEAERKSEADYEAGRPVKPGAKAVDNPASIVAAAPPAAAPAPAAKPAIENKGTGLKPNEGSVPNIGGIKFPTAPVPETQAELDKGAAERVASFGINEGIQKARATSMAEKANAADEARRATALRMAEFFGAWGSTPGTTVVAGLNALKNKIPDFISDMKEEAKIRRQIDKDIAELDKLERDEKNGIKKDYYAERQKLADRAMHQYGYELTAASSRYSADASVRAAGMRASGAGKDDLSSLESRLNTANANITSWEDKNSSLVRRANRGDQKAKDALANNSTYQNLIEDRNALRRLIETNPRVQKAGTDNSATPTPSAGKVIQYDAKGNRV